MQLRFTLVFLALLCAVSVLALIGWFEGEPVAMRLAPPILLCFAVVALLQWWWVGRVLRRLNEKPVQRHTQSRSLSGRNEPQLDAQPAPVNVVELANESTVQPITHATVDAPASGAIAAANNSLVAVLDLKHEVTGHVDAIRSMGKSMSQRAQDPAFTQASKLIVESADRIDTAIDEVLARNDGQAQDCELTDGLRNYIDQCKQRAEKTRFTLRLAPNIDSVSAPVAKAIDLIVKGAIENAMEHSGASHIESNLRRVNEELEVQIADNGVGLPQAGLSGATGGLQTMRDRANALGGSVDIGKSRLGGVVVKARIPAFAMPAPQVVNG